MSSSTSSRVWLTLNAPSEGTHAYEIEIPEGRLTVYANNRNSAASKARKAGYVVKSVNLVG